MKWPFKRNKNVDGVPQEIQEYYQTEKRERTGVAWLLALGTLLITVGLAIALFFGGRWAYRAITSGNNDKSSETTQVAQSPSETPNENENNQTPSTNDEGQTEGANTEGQTSSTSTNQPNNPSQTTGRTQGAATGNLPSTGPSETLALVIATIAIASAAHYAFSKES